MIHCDRCNKDFATHQGFRIHCGMKHKSDLVCRECGLDYGSKTYAEDTGTFRRFAQCKHRAEIMLMTFNVLPKRGEL
ncbi:MAG: hypothetical protein Q6370_020520 [Candidatus Sigynarchaeota archaeon]